jgi:hypothetical protein
MYLIPSKYDIIVHHYEDTRFSLVAVFKNKRSGILPLLHRKFNLLSKKL